MTRCCQVVFQAVVPWESCTRSHVMDSPLSNSSIWQLSTLQAALPL